MQEEGVKTAGEWGPTAAQRSAVGMREAGEESNKAKIINLFHASKSQQNSQRRGYERKRERESVCE